MIPGKDQNPDGLHQRYNVTKADGSPTDPNAVYFVLRLDSGGSDPKHIAACRQAARVYARHALYHLPQVARGLWALVGDMERQDPKRDRPPGPPVPPEPLGPPPVA
jgi:hypothetical protein